MPRTCTICSHLQRAAIDAALISGEPYRVISRRFAASADAVFRHKEHIVPTLAKAQDAAEAVQGDTLLARLATLNRETSAILKEAREANDNELALKAIARAEKQLELEAKLLGELNNNPQINILITPEWLTVRSALLSALMPFPEARQAVVRRLLTMEAQS